ncbi:MAG TPA: outer membrane beta-barrel protein [Bacteroidia bacterium]|nr:outer membrane beta-barrel protein [Bacteroidia bacterium]
MKNQAKFYSLMFLMGLILVCSTRNVFAGSGDDDDDKKYSKGIRVGYQSSNLSESDWDNLNSFYVGIFGCRKFGAGKLLSLYSGLEYYQTGSEKNADNKIVLSYLDIPINLKFKLGMFYAFGGFNPAFKVSDNAKVAGKDVDTDFDSFDIGGQLGVGIKFLFFGAEVKYNQGLIDIGNSNTTSHLQAGLCFYF